MRDNQFVTSRKRQLLLGVHKDDIVGCAPKVGAKNRRFKAGKQTKKETEHRMR